MDGGVVVTSASSNEPDECRLVEWTFTHTCQVTRTNLGVDPRECSNQQHFCLGCQLSEFCLCNSHNSSVESWCHSCKVLICTLNLHRKHKECHTMHVEKWRVEYIGEGRKVLDKLSQLSNRFERTLQNVENDLAILLKKKKALCEWKNLIPRPAEFTSELAKLSENRSICGLIRSVEHWSKIEREFADPGTSYRIISPEEPIRSQEAQNSAPVDSASSSTSIQDVERTAHADSTSTHDTRTSASACTKTSASASSSIPGTDVEISTRMDSAFTSIYMPEGESSTPKNSASDGNNSWPEAHNSGRPSRPDAATSSVPVESTSSFTIEQDSRSSVTMGSTSNVSISHLNSSQMDATDGSTSRYWESPNVLDPTKLTLTVSDDYSAGRVLSLIRNRSKLIGEVRLLYNEGKISPHLLGVLLNSMNKLNCTVTVAVLDSLNSEHFTSGTSSEHISSEFQNLRSIARKIIHALKNPQSSNPHCSLGQFFGRLDKQTMTELSASPLRILGLSVRYKEDVAVVKKVLHKVDGKLVFKLEWTFLAELYLFISNEIDPNVWNVDNTYTGPKKTKKVNRTRKTIRERKENNTANDAQLQTSDCSTQPTLNVYFLNIDKKGTKTMTAILQKMISPREENAVLRKLFFTCTSETVFAKHIIQSIAACDLPQLKITLVPPPRR